MKSATLVALKAILESDQPRSKQDKETLLSTLGLTDNGNEPDTGDRIVGFAEASRRLSCSKRSLHNWVKSGIITKVTFPKSTRARGFLASDIDALLRTDADKVA